MDLLTKAADETARMDSDEVVGYLLARLGRTLTAYIANTRSRSMPARWAKRPDEEGHATPSDDKMRRLNAARAVFLAIEELDNDQVARNWLIAANPRLGGRTPAECIREDQIPAVFQAASAFGNDAYYS